jgi:hypothetical protein
MRKLSEHMLVLNLTRQAKHRNAPIVNALRVMKCAFEDAAAMQ